MISMKELELVDAFCAWLDGKNIEYKREVQRVHGYFDIIVKKGGILTSIEAKLQDFQGVYQQGLRNMVLVDYSYILFPKLPGKMASWLNPLFEARMVGIIFPANENWTDFTILKARYDPLHRYTDRGFKEKIVRNWNENRTGRFMNEREIPENYSEMQRSKLRPDDSWKRKKIEA